MKAVIQRVKEASVIINVNSKIVNESSIDSGLLILLGISPEDTQQDIDWLTRKISNMRIFEDEERKMNRSVLDINGEILVVSQFTLYGDCKKGNRPSFNSAAKPEIAIPLYNEFIKNLSNIIPKEIKTGEFGADMKVKLINDGPVTIIIDSKDI